MTNQIHQPHRIMTEEKQQNLMPQQVLDSFIEGNKKFVTDDNTVRPHSKAIRITAEGQFPKAVVLSCLDSRIPVEDVFDKGIGDIFVARIAGNFVNQDILGSMEFGCKVSGAKLIVVLGHKRCGAIIGAINKVDIGNIGPMVQNIDPAIAMTEDFDGEKKGSNYKYVDAVAEKNIHYNIEKIRNESPILKEMEDNGDILIVGAMYDLDSGVVEFL